MARQYKTGLIITGDASGGIKAVRATEKELGELNKGFDRGSKGAKRFASESGGVSREMQVLRRMAAPVGAALAGMFAVNSLRSQIAFGDQLQKTNLRIGASTEALSEYAHVANLAGVQFDQMATAWQRQSRRIAQAAQGTGEAKDALKALNLNAAELAQLAPEDQFERIAEAMEGVAGEAQRVALAQKLWDSEGVKLLQVVNQGTAAMRAQREEARRLGLTISQDTADAMAGFGDEVTRLSAVSTGLQRQILAELVPAMTSGMQATSAWIDRMGGATAILETTKNVVGALAIVMAGRYAGSLATATAAKLAATRQAVLYQMALGRMAGVSATAAASQTALAVATRGAAGAMALLGGPVGAVVVTVGALALLGRHLDDSAEKAKAMEFRANELAASLKEMGETSIRTQLAAVTLELAKMDGAQQALEEQSRRSSRTNSVLGAEFKNLRDTIQTTVESARHSRDEHEGLRTQQLALEKALDLVTTSGETASRAITDYGAASGDAAESTAEAAKATEAHAKALEDLRNRLTPGRQATIRLARDMNTLSAALASGRLQVGEYLPLVGSLQQSHMDAGDSARDLADTTDDTVSDMARAWQRAEDDIDRAFADAFQGAFDSFEDFSDRLLDAFKRLLAELAYQATLKPIVVGFSQDMGGMMGIPGMGGAASPGSGGFEGTSLALRGSTAGQAIGNAFRAFQGTGSTYAGTFGSELAVQTEGGLRAGFDSFAASSFGNAALGVGGGLAGGWASGEVFGSSQEQQIGSTLGGIAGQVLIPIPGVGAAIGSFLGGGLGSLFGSSPSPPQFDVSQGTQAGIFGDRETAFGQFGATALSKYDMEAQGQLDELLNSMAALDNALAAAALPDRFEAMQAAIEDWAHSGPEDMLESRLRTLVEGSGHALAGAIAQMTDPDEMANAIIGTLQLERIGATLGGQMAAEIDAELARHIDGDFSGAITAMRNAAAAAEILGGATERLNLLWDETADGAIHAAGELANLAGGLGNLAAMQQSYYQAFFTETERAAHLQDDLTQALSDLGMQLPETRQGFRDLVEAQDLNTDAGRRAKAQLLAVHAAFAELVPAAQQAAGAVADYSEAMRTQATLERQILNLQGDTQALRARELEQLREIEGAEQYQLVALQRRAWALEDEQERMRELERAQQERSRALEREAAAMSRAREQLAGFTTSINDWLAQLRGTDAGMGTPQEQLSATRTDFASQLVLAESGDRAALQSITQYADRYLQAGQGMFASGSGAQQIRSEIEQALGQLPSLLSAEMFLAEEIVGAIEEQTSVLSAALSEYMGEAALNIDALIEFATNEESLSDLARYLLTNEGHHLLTTLDFIEGVMVSEDLKWMATHNVNALTTTLHAVAGADVTDEMIQLATGASNMISTSVTAVLAEGVSEDAMFLALEKQNRLITTVDMVFGSQVSDGEKELLVGSALWANKVVELTATTPNLTDTDRALLNQVDEEVNKIVAGWVELDAVTADQRALLEASSETIIKTLSASGGDLSAEQFQLLSAESATIAKTIEALGGNVSDDQRAILTAASDDIVKTIAAVTGGSVTAEQRDLLDAASSTIIKTLATSGGSLTTNQQKLLDASSDRITKTLAASGGSLSTTQRSILDAASESITKTLYASGGSLSATQRAILEAATGNQWLSLSADVAFSKSDLDELNNIESNTGRRGALENAIASVEHETQQLALRSANSSTGMRVSWARNHDQNAFRDLASLIGVHGSHATGLGYVPFDGYRAELHKGEMVVPADDAESLRRLSDMPGVRAEVMMPATPLLGGGDVAEALNDLRRENRQLREDINRLLGEGNRHLGAANAQRGEGFKRMIGEQQRGNRHLDDLAAGSRLEAAR